MFERIRSLFFRNVSARQTLVKNVVWLTVGQFASRFIRAAIIIYAARVLGAGEYGVYSYALGLAGFFTLFADVGINSILTRESAKKPEVADQYFATSFVLKFFLLVVTALAVIFLAPLFSNIEGAKVILPFVALLTVFDNMREFCNAFFRAKERMEWEAITTVVMNVAITVIGFFALSYAATAKSLTISYVSSVGLGMAIGILIIRKQFSKLIADFDRSLMRPIIRAAWQIALLGLLGVFMLNVDMVMLGWLKTSEDLGYYSAGQKIVQVLYTIPAILASATFPLFSRLVATGEKVHLKHVVEKTLEGTLLIAVPIAVGGIVLAESIIRFVYGNAYIPSVLTFQILLGTVLFIFPGIITGNLIFAYDQQRKILKYTGLTSLGNVIFNVLLIPPLGIAGAAIATLAMQIMYNNLTLRVAKSLLPIRIFPRLKSILVAGVIMGGVAYFLNRSHIHVLITIGVASILYLGLLFLMRNRLIYEDARHMMKKTFFVA